MDNSRLSGFSLAPIRALLSRCCYRNELKKRITPARLGRMLARKGIDLQYYLYSQPTAEILRQLSNCEHCHSVDQCNAYLDDKKAEDRNALSFCRNSDAVLKTKHEQDSLYV